MKDVVAGLLLHGAGGEAVEVGEEYLAHDQRGEVASLLA